ncbi:alpha/beta hydrolase [Algoriphagus yeomjeoni]|uniref:Alpha-glucosidase n=1 Tax=Algoriphagus yeomjeoni TaxID=291403 RepID=A0A327PR70_9BACT|nr:alpha/beta hydrolase-fold protein [Algoriphagus yeomjeoni]RAI92176.1 alpha-glucosidase [Algoriphagus yeomjeoni]
MKIKLFYLIGLILLLGGVYIGTKKIVERIDEKKRQESIRLLKSTASPNVEILYDTIPVDYLNEKRTIAIYLPENYQLDCASYSVLYFLDGQSLFDQKIQEGTEWELDEVIDSLGQLGGEQSIVVGLYNSKNRTEEYKPLPEMGWFADKSYSGDKHAAWIVETVKPWVDTRYRTKKEANSTIIGGASLGGLMSYYMLMKYPSVFGGAIVFSPSFWINDEVYKWHETNEQVFNQKIYFNGGNLERAMLQNVEKMQNILLNHGVPKENIKVDVEDGFGHSNSVWKNGFKKAYPWILSQ